MTKKAFLQKQEARTNCRLKQTPGSQDQVLIKHQGRNWLRNTVSWFNNVYSRTSHGTWSFMKGFELLSFGSGKFLVLWICGPDLWEVVAMKVWLYFSLVSCFNND